MNDLERRSWRGLAQFVFVFALILFVPAWSLDYWEGVVFFLVYTLCLVVLSAYFLKHDPALVERRSRGGPTAEKDRTQKIIQTLSSVWLFALFVVPALDHRFGWSHIPLAYALAANVFVVLGFWIIFRTFQENSYAAAIVEKMEGQTVVSTGPYAWVRHPMYAGAIVMFLATPIALGSYWGLLPFIGLIAVIVWRLFEEEKFLVNELPGYAEYRQRVRYRLVPYVW